MITLQVQLRGDSRWFKVKISCPLLEKHGDRIQLDLTCACLAAEWKSLIILVRMTSCFVPVCVTKNCNSPQRHLETAMWSVPSKWHAALGPFLESSACNMNAAMILKTSTATIDLMVRQR